LISDLFQLTIIVLVLANNSNTARGGDSILPFTQHF